MTVAGVPLANEVASVQTALKRAVQTLHPAYFAMVMATGVVAIAAHVLVSPLLAQGLAVLNIIVYVVLFLMTLARVCAFPQIFFNDLIDHNRGVGFFTMVAATSVLGRQFIVVFGRAPIAMVLWIIAVVLWVILMYAIFAGLTIKESKPSLAEGINGGWLIAVVATQAVAELGALLVPEFGAHGEFVLFMSLSMWLCGGMLYIWMISLIFYRYTFFRFLPSDLMPPYWINMGAMAISTLVGTTLIRNAERARFLEAMLPFLQGFTVFFWATATWWIPMLFVLAIWRHVYKRFKLSYDPLYWGAVFPLGMYTLATFWLSHVLDLPFLMWIPRCFVFIALAAWLLTFGGLVRQLATLSRGQGYKVSHG